MKTFREFIMENTSKGNYVSINGELKDEGIDLGSGVFTKSPHVTLMYSKDSNVPMKDVQKVIDQFPEAVEAEYESMEQFNDDDKYALVLKLKSDQLHEMHEQLKDIGLTHSYDYQPHMTYAYNLTEDECNRARKELETMYEGRKFTLSGYNNQNVIKDWATTK